MAGKIYVVATPIGNLNDLTPRMKQAFEEADFIAAEDTRVSVKLLNHFGIRKPLVSYYEHNLRQKGDYIIQRVLAGETCAVCSDAGTPCISDPGEILVKQAHDADISGENSELLKKLDAMMYEMDIDGIIELLS